MSASANSCAAKLRVLADRTRLHVVRELLKGARNVGELNTRLGIGQSLLSHHLRVLREAGLVIGERAGKGVRYRLAPGVDGSAQAAIDLGCCQLSFESTASGSRVARKSVRTS